MEKIGIFGGSFNPVHLEHINMAHIAIEKLCLDKLIVVPTFMSPHKKHLTCSPWDRYNMLKIAFSGEEKVVVSDFEIKNEGSSYSYITVEHFKEEYKDAKLFLIIGGDMLTDFKRWKYPERIVKAVKIACFGRENYLTCYEQEHIYFKEHFGCDFAEIGYNGKNYSSTRIRVYTGLGLNIMGQTDENVIKYIQDNKLYSGNKYYEYVKKILPERRLIHTAEVVIKGLSKVRELSLDSDKVETACVLHDNAKYKRIEDYPLCKISVDVPPPVVHAFLGAYVAKNVLGVEDEEIIDAIRYHTSGKANMSTLAKLVFTSDMIDDTRQYEGVEKLRAYFEESLEKGFTECLKEEMKHLLNKHQPIFIETLNAYKYYIEPTQGDN